MVIACRTAIASDRQRGSALFCLEAAECVEHKLNHAVVAEGRQGDDLRCGSDHNPERWMCEDFFDVHDDSGELNTVYLSSAQRFKHPEPCIVIHHHFTYHFAIFLHLCSHVA